MSGQGNCITIPTPYLDFFFADPQAHLLGAILNQLVFWSGKPSSQENGWFYKTHEQLAAEIHGAKPDQVRKAVDKMITKYLPGVILETKRKVNGTPKKHYQVNGEALIAKIFPPALESSVLPNGNGDIAESNRQKSQIESAESPNHRDGNIADSYLYTDQYTDQHKQIIEPVGQLAAPADEPQGDLLKIDYQAVLETFHATLPELPKVLKMTEARRKVLRKLWKEYDMNIEKWGAYLRYIAKKCRWMLEDRPDTTSGKTWRKKDFDYLITEKCYLSVKEERANDLPKVERLDTTARDDAYLRIVTQRRKPRNEIEEIAQKMAGSLGRMTDYDARRAWTGIWAQAVAQASENDLGRLAG